MRITLDYRNPTPAHCDVAVFVNGALAGVLKLRQEELIDFQWIIINGIEEGDITGDKFQATGNPGSTFRCPKCGAISYNPNDAAQQYCGRCHEFVETGL